MKLILKAQRPSWCDHLEARKIRSDHNNQILGSVGLRSACFARIATIMTGVTTWKVSVFGVILVRMWEMIWYQFTCDVYVHVVSSWNTYWWLALFLLTIWLLVRNEIPLSVSYLIVRLRLVYLICHHSFRNCAEFSKKLISYPLIRTRTYAYQRVRNVNF